MFFSAEIDCVVAKSNEAVEARIRRETKLVFSGTAALKLYRNVFPVVRVWIGTCPTAGSVSSALTVNPLLFSLGVD